jgi:hypothetical protein
MRVAALLAVGLLVTLVHCGGSTATLEPAPGDDVGGEGGPPIGDVPAQHRPAAVACPSTSTGGVACNDDAECNTTTPGATPYHCFRGHCGPDQCAGDTDCGSAEVCSCAGATRGYAGSSPGNVCVPSDCRVDADCGTGGYCSPTVSSSCGSFYGVEGYYCHRPGDACRNDSDCPANGQEGPAPYCAYDPSVGQWACESSFCAG